jgi:hypothetical protein
VNETRTYPNSWLNKKFKLGQQLSLAGHIPLEQEGEGGNYVILEVAEKLNFLPGDEANKSTLSGNFHQSRLPTVVGWCNLNSESALPFKSLDSILGEQAGAWSTDLSGYDTPLT